MKSEGECELHVNYQKHRGQRGKQHISTILTQKHVNLSFLRTFDNMCAHTCSLVSNICQPWEQATNSGSFWMSQVPNFHLGKQSLIVITIRVVNGTRTLAWDERRVFIILGKGLAICVTRHSLISR